MRGGVRYNDIPRIAFKMVKDSPDQASYEDTLFDILGADAEEFRAYLREKRRRAGDEDVPGTDSYQ